MAQGNSTWSEERAAAELLLKFGIRVSPRTVRRYMPPGTGGGSRAASGQRWATFVRKHAYILQASDFCVAVTARFRVLYILAVLAAGSRGLVHVNVTSNPTAT
jgi:putative transposase